MSSTIIASVDATWDSIAYDALNSELQMDLIAKINRRDYADVVTFEGGEKIVIPDSAYQATTIIEPPWK